MEKKRIKLLVFDFDGVMTDNRALIDEDGREFVFVSRADGMGVNLIREKKISMLILSSEKNKVVTQRGRKLGIDVIQGELDKKSALISYCNEKQISLVDVAYVGNDINDYEVMKIVGTKIVPSDSHKTVKKIADIVLDSRGGQGVVREIADILCDPSKIHLLTCQ